MSFRISLEIAIVILNYIFIESRIMLNQPSFSLSTGSITSYTPTKTPFLSHQPQLRL